MTDDSLDNASYSLMVVDDEPIVHQMIARILERSHLPLDICAAAASAGEALQLARQMRPHICLLDIHMEGMDGLELAARMADIPDYHPRTIFLTAYDRFEYARRAIGVGACDYLLKPVMSAELLDVLARTVNSLQRERLERLEGERLQKKLKDVMPSLAAEVSAAGQSRAALLAGAARDFADSRYADRIALTDAADYLHVSSGYLGSLFKAEFGIAFKSYLRAVRIARAKELMADLALNLTEVALAVGFDDVNYFSQVFLAETGIRPGEYRGEGRRWAR